MNIETTKGLSRHMDDRERQIERINELLDNSKDDIPMIEHASNSPVISPVSAPVLYMQIPRGKKNAVSLRKLAKRNGLDIETAERMVAMSVNNREPVIIQRGKVWKPETEEDMRLLFKQESRNGITYR